MGREDVRTVKEKEFGEGVVMKMFPNVVMVAQLINKRILKPTEMYIFLWVNCMAYELHIAI